MSAPARSPVPPGLEVEGDSHTLPTSPGVKRPIRKHYADRLTVDLDDHGNLEAEAVRAWYYLQRVADAVDIHVSSSGEGLHFVAYLTAPMPFHKKVEHRRAAGDDPRRVDMEIQRWQAGLQVDVIFCQKDGGLGEGVKVKDRRFADVWDALDAIRENTRDDYERVKRLANHGHKGAPDLARRSGL
jgi:hypothetical protein